MDRRDSRIGFIALAVGVLALFVALGGRSNGPQVIVQAPNSPQVAVPTAVTPPQAVAPQAVPQAPAAQDGRGYDDDRRGFGPWGRWGNEGRFGYDRGHRGFFFGPLLAIGLIFLGLKLVRGGRFRRARWNGHGRWQGQAPFAGGPPQQTPPAPPQSNPPPPAATPTPPATGETRRLDTYDF